MPNNRPQAQPVQTYPIQVAYVAPSGALTISVGGTAQQLFAAGEVQNGFYVENPLSATDQGIVTAEPLVVLLTTGVSTYPGAGSIKLQPGDHVLIANPPSGAVRVLATTSAHAFSAFEY